MALNAVGGSGKPSLDPRRVSQQATPLGADAAPFIEQAQQALGGLDAVSPTDRAKRTSQAEAITPSKATPKESVTIVRQMTARDIKNHLLELNIAPTPENTSRAAALLYHGFPISNDTMSVMDRLMKNAQQVDASSQVSADLADSVGLAMSKGLGSSSRSVDVLQMFLNSPQLAQTAQKLLNQLMQFQSVIAQSQSLFSASLYTGLVGILGDLELDLKKLTTKTTGDVLEIGSFDRGSLMVDFKSLFEFLGGVHSRLKNQDVYDTAQGKAFKESLFALGRSITKFLDNLSVQFILSQSSQVLPQDKVMYWMFPNPAASDPSYVEMTVRRDGKNKDQIVDPENNQVNLSMSMPSLGDLGVRLDIKDSQVKAVFTSADSDTTQLIAASQKEFMDHMDRTTYELTAFQSLTNRLTQLKETVIPRLELDRLSRVSTEV